MSELLVPSTEFPNLGAAFRAVKDGDTVVVTQNMETACAEISHRNFSLTGQGSERIVLTLREETNYGVLKVEDCTLSIKNIHFDGARLSRCLWVKSSKLTLTDTSLTKGRRINMAFLGAFGGAAEIRESRVEMHNCSVRDNQIEQEHLNGTYAYGGGMYFNACQVTISGTEFEKNTIKLNDNIAGISTYGNGLFFENGNLTINSSKFFYNTANGYRCFGGGITLKDVESATIDHCVFEGNALNYRTDHGSAQGTAIYVEGNWQNVRLINNSLINNLPHSVDPVYPRQMAE